MEKLLSGVGSLLYGMRFTMLFFYVGLVAIIFGILGKFLLETYKLMSSLLFGGSPNLNTASTNASLAANNTMSWFSNDNRHRVKLTSELRRDEFSQNVTFNQYGSFSYNSLADLQANTPASFTRTLSPRTRTGSQIVLAAFFSSAS